MEKISRKLEKLFAAAAFAEEGAPEAARQLMQEEVNDCRTDSRSKGVPISISPLESRG